MNKIFFLTFLIYITNIISSPIEEKYPILESSLEHTSFIRHICLSDATNYPPICADCNTVAKIFELNQKAGFISYKLQENEQKKTRFLFSSAAKIIRRKKLQNTLSNLENRCIALSKDYSESIFRLLSKVDLSERNIEFDDLLAYEHKLLRQGLINAGTNVSVEDYDKEQYPPLNQRI